MFELTMDENKIVVMVLIRAKYYSDCKDDRNRYKIIIRKLIRQQQAIKNVWNEINKTRGVQHDQKINV